MGDPKFPSKHYNTPSHPWQKVRIEEERTLIHQYGLKNKREIWKANTKMNEAKQIGFLAHELQEQLPLAVKGEKDAMSEKDDTLIAPQSIKGEALSSYMMKALQEIITRLEALENA